jgi:hypothetical protein
MHARIAAFGQLTRGDHRQTHHCQLIQSICDEVKKVPMLSQAVMDRIYQMINSNSNESFFVPMNEHDEDLEEALYGNHDDKFDTTPTSNDCAENTTNNQTVCLISPANGPASDNKWFRSRPCDWRADDVEAVTNDGNDRTPTTMDNQSAQMRVDNQSAFHHVGGSTEIRLGSVGN